MNDQVKGHEASLERQALAALRKMRQKLSDLEDARAEPIAIVGMGCRLPGGVNDPESFWNLLRNGVDAIREIPGDRWQIDDYFDPNPSQPGKTYSKWGGFMDQIDQFDPEFFGISAREAVHMDPQQRVFLEVAWEALEDAGIPPFALKGTSTGVFVGATMLDYLQQHLRNGDPSGLHPYVISGNMINAIAGRLAYFLGTHGPSISLDTACSSSLVAVDRACRSLRDGECTLAIAGGVNLILAPEMFVCMSKWGMLSPDGRCKTFDARANGYVRAEGCGIIVLKRLSAAQADGDRVLALIRGSAVNQDGPSSGLSVPNGLAQETVIRQALSNAKVEPAAVTYIEAHGTGTSLGDPIEVDALGRVFQPSRERSVFLGSVKTNLGHLESAAGITGLLKVVLMLRHRRIPPHLHLEQLSPHVSWQQYPFIIPTEIADWNSDSGKRIAGVSSFGFSGTNAHVILQEPTEAPLAVSGLERPLHLLTFSAREKDALRTKVANVADGLQSKIPPAYTDLCYTANAGRCHFSQRLSLLCSTGEEAHEKLTAFLGGEVPTGMMTSQSSTTRRPKLAFLFTGQGSQYTNMGVLLYQTSPTFREVLDRCDEILRPYLDRPLLSVLHPLKEPDPSLNQTLYAQPALFALEFALYKLWASWGITPDFVLGHSVGEYVAACVAGVFSLEDGLKLIAERARLMQSQPPGGRMVAVRASEEQVRAAIKPWQISVTIAAINGPQNIVISGASADIEAVLKELAPSGAPARDLNVSHAFHSPLMEPILADFEKAVTEVPLRNPTMRLVSNLTGKVAKPDELTRVDYWLNHLRKPVCFGAGIQALFDLGCDTFLELGPNPVLIGMGQQCVLSGANTIWRSTLRQGRNDWAESLASLQALYHGGVSVDWKGFDRNYLRRKIRVPTYPFQRQRFWFSPRSGSGHGAPASAGQSQQSNGHPLLGDRLRSPALEKTVFESELSPQHPAFLADHQICDRVILPAAAYVEMALAGANQIFGRGPHRVEDLSLDVALQLDFDQKRLVQVIFQANREESAAFEVFSSSQDGSTFDSGWINHVKGRVARPTASELEEHGIGLLNSVRSRCVESVSTTAIYQIFGRQGMNFGPAFQNIRALWRGEGETLAEISLADFLCLGSGNYQFHPALLDACFQAAAQVLPEGVRTAEDEILLPVNIEAVQILQPLPATLWSHGTWRAPTDRDGRMFILDLRIYDLEGQFLGRIDGLCLKRVQARALRQTRTMPEKDWLFEIQWRERPRASRVLTEGAKLLGRSGIWLVLADEGGLGESIRDRLVSLDQACVLVRPGSSFVHRSDHEFQLNPASRPDFERLLTEVAASAEKPVKGVLHLWSLDLPDFRGITESELTESQLLTCGAALHLVQAIGSFKERLSPCLWLVTRGAQALPDSSGDVHPAMAMLWGLGQVIAAEYPNLRCTRIDLDQQRTKEEMGTLLAELFHDESEEDAVVFRNQSRFTPQLSPLAKETMEPVAQPSGPLRLGISQPGILENLRWLPLERTPPGRGEVEIQVQATGLNFRDVLQTLGMYPGKIDYLGIECVGIVARIGEGVSGLQPGDHVMALAPDAFSSHVTVRFDHVARLPVGMSTAEAASIPVTFLTASYGLHRLAGMKAGDRVLIHAAAGGVGLAAVQLARLAGAEIFATAGNLEKQNYLRGLGIAHVFDSRTTAFAGEIMHRTNGRGVDIVLNSLAGEFIQKSVSVLAPEGCFLELGKRGILSREEFTVLRPDSRYYAYDLGDEAVADASLLPGMFAELFPAFSRRELTPLPVTIFSDAQVVDAFRFMAQAKHIGKIVVTKSNSSPVSPLPNNGLRADVTYLITGGLGGLGLETARWMVREGARNLALIGRREPDRDTEAILQELTLEGAQIAVETCDVSQADQVDEMLRRFSKSMPPLRGIIHAAGVLDDGTIEQLDWSRFERVSAPKVLGAWHLHQRTLCAELDFFVLFSAAATLIGSPGQGNYAAANAFMDALAHDRRSRGLTALSINWGTWAEKGMASRLTAKDKQRWASRGLRPIGLAEGMSKLGQLLFCSRAQVVALPADWSRLFADPALGKPPSLLLGLINDSRGEGRESGSPSKSVNVLARLVAEPATRRLAILQEHVQSLASQALGRSGNRSLDPRRPLQELGLDSLLSVELRNALANSLNCSLPATVLFDYPTLESLTRHLAKELRLELTSEVSLPLVDATAQTDLRELQNMSESEAESLLLAELDELKVSGT